MPPATCGPIWSMAARTSGYNPSRLKVVAMSTSLRITWGCWMAVRNAAPPPSVRIADKIGPVDAEPLHQRRDILRHQFEAQGTIDVSGAPSGLHRDRDDLPAFRECRQQGSEHLTGAAVAVQQDQRIPSAVGLVIHFEAVYDSVTARGIRVCFDTVCCSRRVGAVVGRTRLALMRLAARRTSSAEP